MTTEDPRFLKGEEAAAFDRRYDAWEKARREHPCPTCHGTGFVPSDNMWGMAICFACKMLGVERGFEPPKEG